MSTARLHEPARALPPDRLIGATASRARRMPTRGRIARRRFMVRSTKLLLPIGALVLLSLIALWPEIMRETNAGRAAFRGASTEIDAGRISDARYRGVDERGRPYALTASTAVQVSPDRIDLTAPKGDVLSGGSSWVMLQSDHGVYLQHAGLLDLSGHVVLYRDDGMTIRSNTAAIDLKQGAAIGADTVSAEGPFGTLDAMGYALVDKGAIIQFTGPARLILNGRH